MLVALFCVASNLCSASLTIIPLLSQELKDKTYKTNLNKLEHLVLIMFANDTMVVPRESSHFGFYAEGQDQRVVPLEQTKLYTQASN